MNDRTMQERLQAADTARPVPTATRWDARDLDRLLHRRRVRRSVQAGVLLAAVASAALWSSRPRPSAITETTATVRTAATDAHVAAAAARELEMTLRRAQFRVERAAMASVCFGEALASIDLEAGRQQQRDVARLFPGTAAALGVPDRTGEHR